MAWRPWYRSGCGSTRSAVRCSCSAPSAPTGLSCWSGTGSGLTLIDKRLDEARFVWPRIEDGVMRLSPGQLGALFEGLDWKRVHSRRVPRPQLAQ